MSRNNEFSVHELNGLGMNKAEVIRDTFDIFLNNLKDIILDQNTREFSIVKTKLEEACFFAKKAIAVNPDNQLIEGNENA